MEQPLLKTGGYPSSPLLSLSPPSPLPAPHLPSFKVFIFGCCGQGSKGESWGEGGVLGREGYWEREGYWGGRGTGEGGVLGREGYWGGRGTGEGGVLGREWHWVKGVALGGKNQGSTLLLLTAFRYGSFGVASIVPGYMLTAFPIGHYFLCLDCMSLWEKGSHLLTKFAHTQVRPVHSISCLKVLGITPNCMAPYLGALL